LAETAALTRAWTLHHGWETLYRIKSSTSSIHWVGSHPPRGMSPDEPARFIDVGTTKLDEMVSDGRTRPARGA